MRILYNKKFLALIVAMMVACSFVDASGVRSGHQSKQEQSQDRVLRKKIKSGSGGAAGGGGSIITSSVPQSVGVVTPPVVLTPISEFGENCLSEKGALNTCLTRNQATSQVACYSCIKGLSKFASTTVHGLRSCSNEKFNGGFCKGCYGDVLNFFNCVTGKNLVDPTTSSVSPPPTGGSTGSGEGTDANPNAGTPSAPMGDYGPMELCPLFVPESGDGCSTGDYLYLKCTYSGTFCTCRYDSPYFICFDRD